MKKGAIDGMTKDEITGRVNGSPDHEKFVFISVGGREAPSSTQHRSDYIRQQAEKNKTPKRKHNFIRD